MESKIIKVDAEMSGEHAVYGIARQIESALGDAGYEVDLTGPLTARGVDVGHDGMITPCLSDDIHDFIREGKADFSLNHLLDEDKQDHNLEKTGAANVTSIAEQFDMNAGDVVRALIDDGQINDVIAAMRFMREDSDPSAVWIVAYILLTYGKGWHAERVLTKHEDFSAGGIANEMAGQDVRYEPTGEMLQLKPMTTYAKNSKQDIRDKDVKHIFYQWTSDGRMHVTDVEKANEMSGNIATADGVSKVKIKVKNKKNKHPETGDRYQYLSW